jgi:choline kinase
MKIVILAAGLGSRLDETEAHLPKPLTLLANGESILEYQLNALSHYVSLDQIFIVVGYQKEAIMHLFPNLIYIYNPAFAEENTAKSLLRALRKINEDVLWLNGDVIFRKEVLLKIIEFNRTGMVVNCSSVGEEEVKYRADEEGHILEISKQVQDPQGEALGINFFTKEDLPLLKKNLELCHSSDYFEKAIGRGIKEDFQLVWSIPIDSQDCTEIDFPHDLKKANEMLKQWS